MKERMGGSLLTGTGTTLMIKSITTKPSVDVCLICVAQRPTSALDVIQFKTPAEDILIGEIEALLPKLGIDNND